MLPRCAPPYPPRSPVRGPFSPGLGRGAPAPAPPVAMTGRMGSLRACLLPRRPPAPRSAVGASYPHVAGRGGCSRSRGHVHVCWMWGCWGVCGGGGGSGGRGWPPRHSVVCVLAIQQSPGGLERQWLLFIGFYTRSIIDSFCSTADAMGLTGFLMSGKVWQAVAVCEGLCVCAGVTPCEGKGWAKCACGFFIRIPACDAHAGLHRESDCAA
jgi:hypothetical protein